MFYTETSNNTDVEECKGCTIIRECEVQPKVREEICPCTICLIKAICKRLSYCPQFFEFQQLYESYHSTPQDYEECIGCRCKSFCYANHMFSREIVKRCPCSICLVKAACRDERCIIRSKYIDNLYLREEKVKKRYDKK